MAATVALKKEISKPKWLEKGGQGFSKNKRNMQLVGQRRINFIYKEKPIARFTYYFTDIHKWCLSWRRKEIQMLIQEE